MTGAGGGGGGILPRGCASKSSLWMERSALIRSNTPVRTTCCELLSQYLHRGHGPQRGAAVLTVCRMFDRSCRGAADPLDSGSAPVLRGGRDRSPRTCFGPPCAGATSLAHPPPSPLPAAPSVSPSHRSSAAPPPPRAARPSPQPSQPRVAGGCPSVRPLEICIRRFLNACSPPPDHHHQLGVDVEHREIVAVIAPLALTRYCVARRARAYIYM